MRRGCSWISLLSWGLAVGFPMHVGAQPGGVVLEWSAPSDCASRGALAAEIERLLGRPLSEAPATHVRAVVVRREPELRLELRMERDEGGSSRALDGPTCDALVRAGALIIAVAIDPDAVVQHQESEPGETPPSQAEPSRVAGPSPRPAPDSSRTGPSTESEPTGVRAAAPTSEQAREARGAGRPAIDAGEGPDVRFIASATPALSIGPLPAPAPTIALSLGFGIGPVEITLAALATMEQEAQLEDEAGGRLGLAAGRLRGCASLYPVGEWLELLPCLIVEAGAIWGHGVNVPIVRSGTAPWIAAAAALEARFWLVDALALGLSADLLIPAMRPRFVLSLEGEPQELHRAYEVGTLIALTITLRLR